MARFLKVIVNIILIGAIVVAAALLVPTVMGGYGISTVIVDDTDKDTNLPLGSVAYAKDTNATELQVGDIILNNDTDGENVYEIKEADIASGSYVLADRYDATAADKTATLRNSIQKVVIVVPFIGYIVMAMHSMEGIIIIGLAVLFLIILFILAELWKKNDDEEEELEDEDMDEEEAAQYKSKRQLKKEAKLKAKQEKKYDKVYRKAEKKAKKNGGFVEDYLDEDAPLVSRKQEDVHEAQDKQPVQMTSSPEAIMESVAGEIAMQVGAVTEDNSDVVEELGGLDNNGLPAINVADIQKMMEDAADKEAADVLKTEANTALDSSAKSTADTLNIEGTANNGKTPFKRNKIAMPKLSADEIISKTGVDKEGETPEVLEDKELGVTLVDFTDLL